MSDELFSICQARFGLQIHHAEPIDMGWLNAKWLLQTDAGKFVLKKYHPKRYKHIDILTTALMQQQRLFEAQIPCPALLAAEGAIVQQTDSGDRYIIMRHCEGILLEFGAADQQQMYELGRTTAAMHQLLNDGTLAPKAGPLFVAPKLEKRLAFWDGQITRAEQLQKWPLIPIIEQQMTMVQDLDLELLLRQCRHGWAHRDLWMDNLLFAGGRVSAVLDFDRLNYDYPELDIARAVLSGALSGDELDIGKTAAFMQGYRELREFPSGQLAMAIRMLCYMESEWWIQAERNDTHRTSTRFANEMSWIASRHAVLNDLLGGI